MKKKTLVIGASLKSNRYSTVAIKRLTMYEHPVVAIGLREGKVSGVDVSVEKEPFKDIDTVTLYINPSRQAPYYDYIITLNPARVIFNPGTENPEFFTLLKENNIDFEVACTLVLLGTNQY
ncbi:MAG: putative CoA-binding protein [Planctomycetota bacterium]|jgi:predicted CoA-binding protein